MALKTDFLVREELRKYRPFLWPALIVLVILLSSLLLLGPKVVIISRQQREFSFREKKLARVTQKLDALQGLNENELSTKTQQVLKVLPAEKDVSGCLMAIRGLAQSVGLEVADIKVSPGEISTKAAEVKKRGKVPFLDFQLKLKGPKEGVKVFLEKVASLAPLMRIEEVIFTQDGRGGGEAKLTLDLFYLSLPKTLGSVETPLPKITLEEDKTYQQISQLEAFQGEIKTSLVRSGKEDPFSF